MKPTLTKLVLFLAVIFVISSHKSMGQSIGFDFGISGAQNYGEPNSTFGFSLIMPFSEKFEGVFSFYQWRGEDDNYTLAKNINKSGTSLMYGRFYGNKGLNLMLNYKYFSDGDFTFFFGAGLSQFEMLNMSEEQTVYKNYFGAYTIVPIYVKYKLSESIGLYTRGSLSSEVNEYAPNWGSLCLGLEIKPF